MTAGGEVGQKLARIDGKAVAARLREAMALRGISAKQLPAAVASVEGEKVRGASYGGLRLYLDGDVRSPRVELLRRLAAALQVREPWLIWGAGPRTDAEAASEGDLDAELREMNAKVSAALAHSVARFEDLPRHMRLMVLFTWARYSPYSTSEEPGEEEAEQIGRAIMAPLESLGLDPASLPPAEYDNYIASMCSVLLSLTPSPREALRRRGEL